MTQRPIEIHYWPTPNGHKITIMCEECGLPYVIKPVNIGRGEQFKPEFLAIAPNNRMPAIVDPDGPGGKPISIFETGGSTGVPKSRINYQDFRIDYSQFSESLPEAFFPKGADWLQVGPSGPRRLRGARGPGLEQLDRRRIVGPQQRRQRRRLFGGMRHEGRD